MFLLIIIILIQISTTAGYVVEGVACLGVISGITILIVINVNKKIGRKADRNEVQREFNQIHQKINHKAEAKEVTKIGVTVDQIHKILIEKK